MKRITLDKILDVLKNGGNEMRISEGKMSDDTTTTAAKRTLTRMLELAR